MPYDVIAYHTQATDKKIYIFYSRVDEMNHHHQTYARTRRLT